LSFGLSGGEEIPDAPEFLHLRRCAEGDADEGVHGGKEAGDFDVVLFEVGDDGGGGAVGLEHGEIGLGRDGLDVAGFGLREKCLAIAGVAFFAHLDIVEIVVGDESAVGADGVDAFFEAKIGERADFFGRSDGIADADSGEAIDFGKSASDEDAVVVHGIVDEGGVAGGGGFDEMVIGLVDENGGAGGKFADEIFEIFAGSEAGGGIVWITDIDEAGGGVGSGEHG